MTGPFLKVLGTNKAKYLTQSTLLTQKLHCFEKMFFHRMQKLFCWIFQCILHCTGVLFLSCTDLGTKGEIWLQAIGWGDPSIHSALLWRGQSHSKPQPSHIHEAGFQTKDFNRHLKKTMETIYHSPAWCHMSTSHATDNIKQTVPSSQPVRQLCNDSMLQRNKIAKSRLKKK